MLPGFLLCSLLGLLVGPAQAFDLQFNSVTDVDPAPTSGVLQYTVQIENSGVTAATDVRTVFAIPDGAAVETGALALPASASANCSVSGAYIVCSHGDMAGTGGGGGTLPIVFTLKFRAPAALPAPPNVRLRGAIGRGTPPLASAQAHPMAFFASGSGFWTGDSNENNNTSAAPSSLQQTTLENNADLSVALTASANPVVSGTRLLYSVSVTNNGPTSNDTHGVRVFSTLPAGAAYVAGSASGAGWSFAGPSGNVLTATRGAQTLAVGATVTFTYEVEVTIAAGTLSHNAEVNTDRSAAGSLLDNNPNNNTASLATRITPSANLALTKSLTSGGGPFVAGSTLSVRLAPRNLGQSSASNVVLRDVLPVQHTLAVTFPLPPSTLAVGSYRCRTNAANQDDADQADIGRAARSMLRCIRATLPVGDVENIDFTVLTNAGFSGTVINTATISAATADPDTANNSSSVSYTLLPDGADVELVSYNKLPAVVVATGGAINHAVRLRNNGPRAVNANLQVFISLGASETLVSAAAGWSCGAEPGGVRCTYTGSYPVASGAVSGGAGFADLNLVTQANAAGMLNSQACVGGSGGTAEPTVAGFTAGSTSDFITGNDCSGVRGVSASSQISDLVMSKTTRTPTGNDKVVSASENSASFTLTVTNQGPTSTPGVAIEDYLPGFVAGATVVSICDYTGPGNCTPPAASNLPATLGGWTCSLDVERLTCRSNSTVLGVGSNNAKSFVVQMTGRLRDSLSAPAFAGCSGNGQFCNQATASIEAGLPGASVDSNINNNAGFDTLVVHAAANIQTESKTFSPAQAQVGVDTEYTVNYRNPAASRSDLPAVQAPGAGVPAGVVFVDTFNLAANDAGFVLRSATIVAGAACSVVATTGGVVAAAGAGGISYSTLGGAAGTVRIECPAVTMPRNTDRQLRLVVRPNIAAVGSLTSTAGFRIVDTGGATVSASGATYDLNTDRSTGDDTRSVAASIVGGQVDLRVENTDLQDPVGWDAAAVNSSPGASDIVYRVLVRNGGPSLATHVRLDYTITPPPNATIRFVGDEAGTAVTMASGATAPQRCTVLTGSNPVLAPATLTLRCATPGYGFTPNIDGAMVQGTQAGEGATLNIRLRFESAPSLIGSTVATLAVVAAAESELDFSNNSESEVTTVRTSSDLAISKTAVSAAVPALPAALPPAVSALGLGQPLNWVVELLNNGPGDSLSVDRSGSSPLNGSGTVITDTLPAGVTVTGAITWQKTGSSGYPGAVATGTGTCSLVGLGVTCNVGDVGQGGRVRVTLPVRWDRWPGGAASLSEPQANNAAATTQTTDPVGGNNTATHAVQLTRSSLAGVVFEDRDRTGANSGTQQDPAVDPPLAGVTVGLRAAGGVNAHGTPFAPRSTTTDVNGAYRFGDLPAGSYEIVQLQLPGYGNSPGDPTAAAAGMSPSLGGSYVATGTEPAGVPLPAGANSRYTAVVLGAQQDGVRYNFPELAQNSSISGVVFEDRNRDGSLSAGEPGISGITLRLIAGLSCTGTVLGSTTTDAAGAYSFSTATLTPPHMLTPGAAYSVCQVQPAAFEDGSVNPGSGAAVGGANHIIISALPLGGSLNNQFGELPPRAVPVADLVVGKTLAPATFTELNRGSYTLTVRNTGTLASSGAYTVIDTLPAGMTVVGVPGAAPVAGYAGWACSVAGLMVTCSSSDVIAAGASHPASITVAVQLGQNLCGAGVSCGLDNVVSVSGGGEPVANQPNAAERANPPACTTPATQNVCRLATPIQQSGGVSGLVWLDVDHDRRYTAGTDIGQGGFIVELYQGDALLRTTTTDTQGQYQFVGLVPGNDYELRFRDASTGAYYGRPVSTDPAGGNDPRATDAAGVVPGATLRGFVVPSGNGLRLNQNLPLDPSGVVYDSQTRQPVGGARVELLGPGGQPVPAACVLGGRSSINTSAATSGSNLGTVPGGYAFWLLSPAPQGCPGDGHYTLRITPPTGYVNAGVASGGSLVATSSLIPAQAGAVQVPGSCQAYVSGAPCAVQNQPSAPSGAQPTPYFFTVPLAPNSPAGFVDIVNNHIPLDPLPGTRFVISKQASRSTVEVGDAVSYTIVVRHLQGAALADMRVDDTLPAGFRYVPGTYKLGGALRADPAGAPGPTLRFDVGALPINGTRTFSYVARAGVGAQQGDGINTAQASAGSTGTGTGAGTVVSNIARARVRVTGGVFGADACVVGKIYVDCNHNQVQDREELGIPGVRLWLQDGTHMTSDSEGKYSLCGLPPRTQVLKVDPLTLPRGSRLVTSSSRNAGDAHSIFIDLKNGDLQRADFIEGSCSNTVLEHVKARRTQGEVRAAETEKAGGAALKFEGKAPGYPQQGTDSANQPPPVRPRENAPGPRPPAKGGGHEQNLPVPGLPAASSNTQRP